MALKDSCNWSGITGAPANRSHYADTAKMAPTVRAKGVSVDDTHNVTRYALKLASVMVVDERDRGLQQV
ncbi:hypothetical protein TELCIR_01315 [Teladorsagia circumcincta]|uniref:Uncharacterized protein n=1 Tax=Teladorsagia circumcincta TaxID=45464 RepID=A0A2G9V2L1_TELCI|nr:hypothetical protein TELCIR_01315 [Teladorsagia circumcincta]